MGSANAAVLPVPVCAMPTTSRCEHLRNGLGLDRSGGGILLVDERTGDGLAEAEVEKGGQSGIFRMAKRTGAPNVRIVRHWHFWMRKSAQADCGGEQPRVAGKLDTPRGLGCR